MQRQVKLMLVSFQYLLTMEQSFPIAKKPSPSSFLQLKFKTYLEDSFQSVLKI